MTNSVLISPHQLSPPVSVLRQSSQRYRLPLMTISEGHSLIPPPTPQLRDFRTCAASPLGVQKSLHCGATNRQRLRRCLLPQWVSTLRTLSARVDDTATTDIAVGVAIRHGSLRRGSLGQLWSTIAKETVGDGQGL